MIKKISCTGTCICEYFILSCNACLIRMFSKLKIAFRVLCWWCSAQYNCFTNRLENRRPGICSWEFKLKTVLELLQRCATALSRKSFWIVRCRDRVGYLAVCNFSAVIMLALAWHAFLIQLHTSSKHSLTKTNSLWTVLGLHTNWT